MQYPDKKFNILIPLNKEVPQYKSLKGRLFEKMIERFLSFQSYKVKERVRDVGTEIDLLCRHSLSDHLAMVECKTQSETLGAAVINKLHTDVSLHEAECGWIFALSELGKEARGRLEKLNEIDGKDKYRFFSPNDLVKRLIEAKAIKLPLEFYQNKNAELFLCVFANQLVWALPVRDENTGHLVGLAGWDARAASR